MICPNCNRKMSVQETRHYDKTTLRRYSCECGVKVYTEEKENPKVCLKMSRIRMKEKKEGR